MENKDKDINIELSDNLLDLMHNLMQFFRENHFMHRNGINTNRGQNQILSILNNYERITQKDLVNKLDMQP